MVHPPVWLRSTTRECFRRILQTNRGKEDATITGSHRLQKCLIGKFGMSVGNYASDHLYEPQKAA